MGIAGMTAVILVTLLQIKFPGGVVGAFLVSLISSIIGGVFYSLFEEFLGGTLSRLFGQVNAYPPLFSALLVALAISSIYYSRKK